MNQLNICFPEWQGYAESNDVYFGSLALQKLLSSQHQFKMVEVPENEELELANDIMGYNANLRQLMATSKLLKSERPAATFMLGGTCASEIAPVSYLNEHYNGDLAVIWFDAHGDLNTPETSPSKHFHGMPLRALLGESDPAILREAHSVIRPEQVVLAGTRDLDEAEKEYITSHNISVLGPNELTSLIAVLEMKGFKNVYIHIDLDVLDPEVFPHLLLPIEGGISINELLKSIRDVQKQYWIKGSSIVEYVPQGSGDTNTIQSITSALGI